MEKKKQQRLRFKVYSVGWDDGELRAFFDVPADVGAMALTYLMPHFKEIKRQKFTKKP